jgi:hypothetical protein
MKKVLPISNPKFPQKAFGVIAVIMLIAFLLSLRPVAEVVKKGVEMLGVKFPSVELFQQANNNVLYACAGALLLIVGLAVVYPIVKIALVVTGAAFVVYSVYKLAQNFFPSFGNNDLSKD